MFIELSLGFWSSRHKRLSTYQVSSPVVVFFVSYMHITCPLYNVLLEVVCCCFPRNDIFKHDVVGSQSFISLLSFVRISAVVNELHESNQNKKKEKEKKNNSEIGYFQFNTFPGYIIHPFCNQRYLLSTCMHSMC